jgi:predicted AlkP superfamily phosphohydrolase/phosphomutase
MQPKASYAEGVQRILDERQGKPPPGPPPEDLLRRARNLLPESVHRAIWLRLPASFRLQRMMDARLSAMDVEHDGVFVLEGDCAVALRLNQQGREKMGVVPPEGARAALDELWREVQRYRTEAGEAAFVDMVITAEAFSGPRTPLLPDAMLLYNPNVIRTRELTRDDGHVVRLTNPESRNGIHTGQGFCFYRSGDDARPKSEAINNVDFAPTVLERIGVGLDARLQGQSFL